MNTLINMCLHIVNMHGTGYATCMYTASYKEVSPLSGPAGQLKFESNYVYRLAIYKTHFPSSIKQSIKIVESTAHAITKQ